MPVSMPLRDAVAVCERLEWDSTFFGVPIARIRTNRLDETLAMEIETWAAAEGIRCLYFLADLEDAATMRIAEQHGYRLVDVRVAYELLIKDVVRLVEPSQMTNIRAAVPDDVPALRAIALHGYRGTRFYNDPDFPTAQCDELYATWIEHSVHGWADQVFVLGPPGGAYGFITCHRDGRIGLSGIHVTQRGRGEGLALYQAAVEWCVAERVEPIRLVTQGTNLRAQRLFQRMGGRITNMALWYHRWLTPTP